jgi:hypothetical protein
MYGALPEYITPCIILRLSCAAEKQKMAAGCKKSVQKCEKSVQKCAKFLQDHKKHCRKRPKWHRTRNNAAGRPLACKSAAAMLANLILLLLQLSLVQTNL